MKKFSKQRELILESLKNRTDHPTAEKLFMDLKKEMPDLGIATVYRNLTDLCEEGAIIKIKARSGPDRYDGNTMPHIHFTCRNCGDIQDIFLYELQIKRLDNEMKKLATEIEAETTGSTIELVGFCKRCKKAVKKNI